MSDDKHPISDAELDAALGAAYGRLDETLAHRVDVDAGLAAITGTPGTQTESPAAGVAPPPMIAELRNITERWNTAPPHTASSPVISAKIVVAGGRGTGKTTFVRAVSEIGSVIGEATLTGVDAPLRRPADGADAADRGRDTDGPEPTTTVALDFGQAPSVKSNLDLHLLGMPWQPRFWFIWDALLPGAIGAVVLVDTRRLADAFAVIDLLEYRHVPYIIGINTFDGALEHDIGDVRRALSIDASVPIVPLDARDRPSVEQTLVTLYEHVSPPPSLVHVGEVI